MCAAGDEMETTIAAGLEVIANAATAVHVVTAGLARQLDRLAQQMGQHFCAAVKFA